MQRLEEFQVEDASRGYFVWTLIDNFECSSGYSHRMGLLRVDRETPKRTVKANTYWLRDLIQNQARQTTIL